MGQADYTHYTDEELLHIYKVYRKNLVDSELKAAKFGELHIPAPLRNEIDDLTERIKAIKAELKRRDLPTSSPSSNNNVDRPSPEPVKPAGPLGQITIIMQGSIETWNDMKRSALVQVISSLANLQPEQIKILRVEEGSIRITIELPRDAAQRVSNLYQSGALRHLQGIGDVLDVSMNNGKAEQSERRQSSPAPANVSDSPYPERPWLRNLFSSNNPIIVALGALAALAAIITLIITWPKSDGDTTFRGRVLDDRGASVQGAKVTLDIGSQSPKTVYTDSEGTYGVVFDLDGESAVGKIRVEHAGFVIYERNITLTRDQPQLEEIRLVRSGEPSPTPSPEAAAPTLTPPPIAGTPTIIKVPENAPLLPVTILVGDLPACGDALVDLAANAADSLKGLDPPIQVLAEPTIFTSGARAREIGRERGAHLVIWAVCENGTAIITAEILAQRGPPEVSEPASLSFSISAQAKLIDAIVAFGLYLRRDYDNAAIKFQTVSGYFDRSSEQRATFRLLRGNSLLFSHQYDEAATGLAQDAAAYPNWPPLVHNIGIAQANLGWMSADLDAAISSFSATLDLDANFDLARVNRGAARLRQVAGGPPDPINAYLEPARRDCDQARGSGDALVRSLAVTCLEQEKISRDLLTDIPAFPDVEPTLRNLATDYWSEPLYWQAAALYNHYDRDKRVDAALGQQAKEAYCRYLLAAQDDVLLALHQEYIDISTIVCNAGQ